MTDAAPTQRSRAASRAASRLNAALDVDLTRLDSLPLAALRDLWRTIGGKGEPVQRRLLIREIAYLVQARRLGGMDKATARLLAAAVRDAREEPAQPTRAVRTSRITSDGNAPRTPTYNAAASPSPTRSSATPKPRRSRLPSASTPLPTGARITRVWRGRTYEVTVAEGGKAFISNGQTYRSLSKVAEAITGTVWSGPLFFGLTRPRRARAQEPHA
ncbi:MAG: DUF2924 domain-containing protein [Phycisphaeraceae bacterium]|nr:DUF2924 domain-containing protein [Phycisphaeraceae bacterium]